MRRLTPPDIHPPFARYAHGVEVPAGARLIVCSGQLGIDAAGEIPAEAEAQTALCLSNIEAILQAGGLGREDIVRLNAYVSDRSHLAGYMAARDAFFAALPEPPASTLMIVSGFARPDFVVEVEAIAAERAA
jgi:enamine deaminase RidA (YjgF/YER057c/UK114 family)